MAVSNGQLRFSTYEQTGSPAAVPAYGRDKPGSTAVTASSYKSLQFLRQLDDVVVDLVGNAPDGRQPQGANVASHRWLGTAFGYHSGGTSGKNLIEKIYLLNERAFYAGDTNGTTHKVEASYLGEMTTVFGSEAAEDVVDDSENQYNYPSSVTLSEDSGQYKGLVSGLVSIQTVPTSGTVTAGEGGGYLAIPDVPGFGLLRVVQSSSTVEKYTQAFRAWL